MKRVLIGIIGFVLWSLVSVQWYVCGVKGLCGEDTVKVNDTDKITETTVSNDRAKKTEVSTSKLADTVAVKNTAVENNAKKDAKAEPVAKEKTTVKFSIEKASVFFPFAKTKAYISKKQKDSFRKLAKEINASDATLLLIGNADTVGSIQKNMEVGQMRAEWLKQVFVSLGLDANRIITKSQGKGSVIRGTNNSVDMKGSRRVDIIVKPK